jgi:hypothetical protein
MYTGTPRMSTSFSDVRKGRFLASGRVISSSSGVPGCIPRAISRTTLFVVPVGEKYTNFSDGMLIRCPPLMPLDFFPWISLQRDDFGFFIFFSVIAFLILKTDRKENSGFFPR